MSKFDSWSFLASVSINDLREGLSSNENLKMRQLYFGYIRDSNFCK